MPYLIALIIVALLLLLALDRRIASIGQRRIQDAFQVKSVQHVIVPGAKINRDGSPSEMLKDRLDTALALFVADRKKRILVSGDGRPQSLNETAVMADYLIAAGVPADQILIDPEGYDTFQTVFRAKYVFGIDSAVMTTQTFHLERAIYIAEHVGLDLQGVASDLRDYQSLPVMRLREVFARVKAFYECAVFRPSPE